MTCAVFAFTDPLEDVNQGYEDMREGRNLRGVIEYTDADY